MNGRVIKFRQPIIEEYELAKLMGLEIVIDNEKYYKSINEDNNLFTQPPEFCNGNMWTNRLIEWANKKEIVLERTDSSLDLVRELIRKLSDINIV